MLHTVNRPTPREGWGGVPRPYLAEEVRSMSDARHNMTARLLMIRKFT
ncbi:hypothetical protein ACIOHA_15610 [Streptomyces anulatus]